MSSDGGGGPGDAAILVGWRADRVAMVTPDDHEVWLFGGPGPVRLAGRGAGPLARAITGTQALAAAIAEAVAGGMSPTEADRIAQKWWTAGHIGPADPDELASVTADPAVAVLVVDIDDRAADRFLATWAHTGMSIAAGAPDLTVLLVADVLSVTTVAPSLTGTTIVVAIHGERMMISPVLTAPDAPKVGACVQCLISRVAQRRQPELFAAARVGRDTPPLAPAPRPGSEADRRAAAAIPIATGIAAHLARAWANPGHAPEPPHVTTIAAHSGAISRHQLVAVAGCPRCDPHGSSVMSRHRSGMSPLTDPDPPVDGKPGPDFDSSSTGAFRVVDPAETWARYAHLISDAVGVVPYVEASGMPQLRAFTAGMNVAASGDVGQLHSRLRAVASGKGLTLTGARTGALAEALERESLRARGDEPYLRTRMRNLDGAIHPNRIQLFSDAQLHRQAQLTALGLADPLTSHGFHRVPLPFDETAEHDWSAVTNLRTGAQAWVPSALMWLGWPDTPVGYPQGCSNGAAAGNTIAEALLAGLLELVERDAVALWWYPRCHRPAFDVLSWDDPRIAAAAAPQHALGTRFWVLDLTTDIGIPTAAAIATGVGPKPEVPLVGFGAHLDPALAVVRALTELAQVQAPISQFSPAEFAQFPGEAERRWFASVTPEAEPWLVPTGVVEPPDAPTYTDVRDALTDAVARVHDCGVDVWWADCTRPDLGLPVVRTFAPGLRHFWARFAPGRLYDVPPALGWCAPGYGEADLNPLPMIL